MSRFYKLNIKEVKRETEASVSVVFNVPEELRFNYQFIAGQYINLKLRLDNEEIRRAYSICSSPESGELRIAIKAVKNGKFSQFANKSLKATDTIEVGIPEGNFLFKPEINRQKNYAAFVAGSGITPVISIIKSVLISEKKSSFVLVYGNKSTDDTMFYQELHDLHLQFLGRLFVHYIFSQQKVDDSLFGRIEKSTINFVLNTIHKEKEFEKFYLCGPEEMINMVSEVLKINNINDKDIKFELFTAPLFEKEIKINDNGHTKISVLVDGETTIFDMLQNQTILEAALNQGLDVPYSCQGGICSSCLARVTNGTAVMKKNAILTDNEVAEGLVLTCQALPTSQEIFINYDDI